MKRIAIFILLFTFHFFYSSAQSWVRMADIPAGCSGTFSFSINDKIYIGGGRGSIALWQYDPATNIWTRKSDLPASPSGRVNAVGFNVGSKGYFGLGTDSTWSTFYSDLWEYDPVSNTWTAKANLPGTGREGAGCFVVNNKAYVIGGAATSMVSQVWEYDPASNTWSSKAPYPAGAVIYPSAFSIGNKGYVACGFIGTTVSKKMYAYDPAANSWTARADLPGNARQSAVGYSVDGSGFCGLGHTDLIANTFADIYKYSTVTNAWALADSFTGGSRWWATAVTLHHSVFVGSGFDYKADWWQYVYPSEVSTTEAQAYPMLFPNPASTFLGISTITENSPYAVTDMAGRTLLCGTIPSNRKIELFDLPSGIYILSVNLPGEQQAKYLFTKN